MFKPTEDFCNLHVHSTYSILDGFGTPKRLVQRAVELGQPALAVTDHGSMSGLLEVKQACEKGGIKFIPGTEFYIAPWGHDVHWRKEDKSRAGTARHLTTWAYNQQGYENLLKLTELANKVGFYYNPRIDYSMLEQYNEGLILTSGCMASDVCAALNPETGVKASDYRLVNEVFSFMMDVFGTDRYFIEVQGHNIPALRDINIELSKVNSRYGFDYVVTNDSHYAYPEDNVGQVDVMCVSQKCSRLAPNKFIADTFQDKAYYMPSRDDALDFDYGFKLPMNAFSNTVRIADMVETIYLGYEPEVKKYRFPIMPEYSHDYDGMLSEIAFEGLEDRYPISNRYTFKAGDRLKYELKVIKDLGFASYFLCVYDIKAYCDKNAIPMMVRGSAGGSIVLYCLGLTDYCPLEYGLLFERFLNPDRVSAPDADLDIDPNRRAEVIKYLIEKYGKDFVAQVVNFNFIKGRGAIRDAARINDAPYDVGDALVDRMVDATSVSIQGTTSIDSKYHVPNFCQSKLEERIVDTALRLEGQIRTTGIHAGAVMLSDRPLVKDYPLMKPKTASKAITELLVGFNYETAEMLGGIKLDILGVEALGILYEAMRLINRRHGTKYTFDTVPVDDPISFNLINSGHLAEIFQLSGYTARVVTKQIKPRNVKDVMAINAIARPGPLQYAQQYADRLHGKEEVTYKHPDLAQVLEETQGIMIYQEQVMRISQIIAGFSGGEADILRKAVSKKKGFSAIYEGFLNGALARGYDKEFVTELWEDILHFAGYGFNASHACSYSRLAVKMAYLKGKYPTEFYAAAMTGRVGNEDKLGKLLTEMKHFNIGLLQPKLGRSKPFVFAIDDDEAKGIRYPYGSVKNVGRAGNHLKKIKLESLRELNSDHLALFKKAGRRPLECLAVVGTFDHLFDGDRNKAVAAVDYLSKGVPPLYQMSFIEEEDQYTRSEFLALERSLTGLYLTGHPLDPYDINPEVQPPFRDVAKWESMHGQIGLYKGVIKHIRLHRDKNQNIMAFVKMEDRNYDTLDVIVFASVYEKVQDSICVGCVIRVPGEVQVEYSPDPEKEAKLEKYGRVSIVAKMIFGE